MQQQLLFSHTVGDFQWTKINIFTFKLVHTNSNRRKFLRNSFQEVQNSKIVNKYCLPLLF